MIFRRKKNVDPPVIDTESIIIYAENSLTKYAAGTLEEFEARVNIKLLEAERKITELAAAKRDLERTIDQARAIQRQLRR